MSLIRPRHGFETSEALSQIVPASMPHPLMAMFREISIAQIICIRLLKFYFIQFYTSYTG